VTVILALSKHQEGGCVCQLPGGRAIGTEGIDGPVVFRTIATAPRQFVWTILGGDNVRGPESRTLGQGEGYPEAPR
jgi:hypothetical protein